MTYFRTCFMLLLKFPYALLVMTVDVNINCQDCFGSTFHMLALGLCSVSKFIFAIEMFILKFKFSAVVSHSLGAETMSNHKCIT